jgi:4-amino-4-deoxy-L-arabinose transferase-like glycosyltransferase
MGKLLDNRLLLLLVLIVFVFCKVPHLYYPYYWDESWPYMPAVKAMHDHGISLMPNAIDADLSRGHPLFFHALAAIWMKIFGASHFAMHSFALFISLLFLIAIYEAGYRLFNPRVAFLGLVMVATQEVFFVQSSFVLLEMLVACLAFLSLCFYIKDKYVFTAITLSMLFYTKESGLVLGFVIGIDALAGLFNKRNEWRMRLFRLASVAFPCLAILIFFLLQKYQRGWYIFPFYNDIIEHSWKAFWYKFRMACVHVAFYDNYKYFYFLVLMALSLIASVKNRKIIYTVVLIPGAIIYYFVDDMRTGRLLPPIPFFMVFVLSVFYFLYVFGGRKMFELEYQRRFIRISGLFILCFLCFSTMNYFTYRYLLAVIIPLLFLTAVFYDMLLARTYKALFYPLIAIYFIDQLFRF